MICGSLVAPLTASLLLSGLSATAALSESAWSDSGVILTIAPGAQTGSVVVPDLEGGVYVAWRDSRPGAPPALAQAYITRFGADGRPSGTWPMDGIRASLPGGEVFPLAIRPDGEGGVALFWGGEGQDSLGTFYRVHMHRFLADGTRHPQFPEGGRALPPFDPRSLGDVMVAGDGGYFIAGGWVGPPGSGSQGGILLTRVDSLGQTAPGWPAHGVVLCDQPQTQSGARLLPDRAGGVIVLWRDTRTGVDARLFGARVAFDGSLDPDWPLEGRDLALLDAGSSTPPGYAAVADSAGFVVAIDPSGLLAFDVSGMPRAGWPPAAITLSVQNNGPFDLFHRLTPSDRGTYVSWVRRRILPSFIFEDQRMLSLIGTAGTGNGPWPDSGKVLNRSVGTSDTLGVGVVQPSPLGLFLTYGARDAAGDHFRGGLLLPDLSWAPGWEPAGREVSRTVGGGSSTIGSDGSLYVCFAFSYPLSPIGGIRLFKLGVDGPVPTQASVVSAEVAGDVATLTWWVVDPPAATLEVERSRDGVAWERAGAAAVEGGDRVTFREAGLAEGERRAYRLAWSEAGERRSAGLVWVARAGGAEFAIRSLGHAVTGERIVMRLTSASREAVQLRVYDVQGRERARALVERPEVGTQDAVLPSSALSPGLYMVRAAQGTQRAAARVVVVR